MVDVPPPSETLQYRIYAYMEMPRIISDSVKKVFGALMFHNFIPIETLGEWGIQTANFIGRMNAFLEEKNAGFILEPVRRGDQLIGCRAEEIEKLQMPDVILDGFSAQMSDCRIGFLQALEFDQTVDGQIAGIEEGAEDPVQALREIRELMSSNAHIILQSSRSRVHKVVLRLRGKVSAATATTQEEPVDSLPPRSKRLTAMEAYRMPKQSEGGWEIPEEAYSDIRIRVGEIHTQMIEIRGRMDEDPRSVPEGEELASIRRFLDIPRFRFEAVREEIIGNWAEIASLWQGILEDADKRS